MMNDQTFFTRPQAPWQRQYEALRTLFVDRQPSAIVAQKFGYTPHYMRQLRHQFVNGRLVWQVHGFAPGVGSGKCNDQLAQQIVALHNAGASSRDIEKKLRSEGPAPSLRTIQRILNQENVTRLHKRSKQEIRQASLNLGLIDMPVQANMLEGSGSFTTQNGGVLLFLSIISQLDLDGLLQEARWPEVIEWSPAQVFSLLLGSKLIGLGGAVWPAGTEHGRLARVFAGLNEELPSAPIIRYLELLNSENIEKLRSGLSRWLASVGLTGIDSGISFHIKSMTGRALSGHPVNSRQQNKVLWAENLDRADFPLDSRMIMTKRDMRGYVDELASGKLPYCQPKQVFVCDAKLFKYEDLSRLDQAGFTFLMPQRRSKQFQKMCQTLKGWKIAKKPMYLLGYRNLRYLKLDTSIHVMGMNLKQFVINSDNRDPVLLITNDERPAQKLIDIFAAHLSTRVVERARQEFFHPAISIDGWPIPLELDLILTQTAQALYRLLAQRLPSYERYRAWRLFDRIIHNWAGIEQAGTSWIAQIKYGSMLPALRDCGLFPATIQPLGSSKTITIQAGI